LTAQRWFMGRPVGFRFAYPNQISRYSKYKFANRYRLWSDWRYSGSDIGRVFFELFRYSVGV